MKKKKKGKHSNLVLPDPTIDVKYKNMSETDVINEIQRCANGLNGLRHFINEYIYVPNKIEPRILKEKPQQFQHLIFEGDKINLKLYAKQEEYLEELQNNRLIASYKSRQCLVEDSLIYTPTGSKKIQDIKKGDVVFSYNEEKDQIEPDIVVDAQYSGLRHCTKIEQNNGNITEQGEYHPFLLSNNRQEKSKDLLKDNKIRYFNEDGSFISNIEVIDNTCIGKRKCYDIETYKNKNFIFNGMIVHNTGISTITQAYLLQYALFNDSKEIAIVSKSEREAIKFLDAIYYMYNHLPFFLRRPFDRAITKSFFLGNKNNCTKITVLTSTPKSGRSFSATLLVLDECEFIDHASTLWGAAQPTLSATGGQAILISTPQLYKSQFWSVCHSEDNQKNAFKVFTINWSDIPGRGIDWYEAQCEELKYDRMKIMTELEMQQIIPYTKYYSEEQMREEYICKKKDLFDYGVDYNISILREYNPNIQYYFGVDTYEEGEDFNAGVIIGDDNRIYASFKTKRIEISDLIVDLCEAYHTKANIERNRGFWLIKEFRDKDLAEKYLLYKVRKQKNIKEKIFGYAVESNRRSLLTYSSEWLKTVSNFNSDSTNLMDPILLPEELMTEMRHFVFKKTRVEGLEHDDLIFSLIAALYVKHNINLFSNYYSKEDKKRLSGLERTKQFYGMLYDPKKKVQNIRKQLTKNILARNVLSDALKDKQLTVEQLDLLESIINDKKPSDLDCNQT